MHVSTCVPVCGRAPAHILLTAVFHHAHGRCVFASAQAYRSPCTPAAASSMSEKSSTLLGPVATGARPPAHRLCCSSQSSPTSSLDMLPIGIRDGPISPPSDTAVIRSPILLYPVRRAEDDAVVMRSAFVMRSAPSQELPVSLCKPRRARRTAPVRPRPSHLLHRTPQDQGNHTYSQRQTSSDRLRRAWPLAARRAARHHRLTACCPACCPPCCTHSPRRSPAPAACTHFGSSLQRQRS